MSSHLPDRPARGGALDDRRSLSVCAGCGRAVTGHDGDIKVYVGHEDRVLCIACFDAHPSRDAWLTPASFGARALRMLRDPDIDVRGGSRR